MRTRWALVRTLRWAPTRLVVAVVGLNLLLAGLPAALALTGGWVVASIEADGAALTLSLVALGVALCADGVGYHAADLAEAQAARHLDGRVRHDVRAALGSLTHIAAAERADVLDDVALATTAAGARGWEHSIGNGATGQLVVWFRAVTAVATAAVLVPLAWWLAAVLLVLTYLARRDQQRRWARLAETASRDAAGGAAPSTGPTWPPGPAPPGSSGSSVSAPGWSAGGGPRHWAS